MGWCAACYERSREDGHPPAVVPVQPFGQGLPLTQFEAAAPAAVNFQVDNTDPHKAMSPYGIGNRSWLGSSDAISTSASLGMQLFPSACSDFPQPPESARGRMPSSGSQLSLLPQTSFLSPPQSAEALQHSLSVAPPRSPGRRPQSPGALLRSPRKQPETPRSLQGSPVAVLDTGAPAMGSEASSWVPAPTQLAPPLAEMWAPPPAEQWNAQAAMMPPYAAPMGLQQLGPDEVLTSMPRSEVGLLDVSGGDRDNMAASQQSLGDWWVRPGAQTVASSDPVSSSLGGWWHDGQPVPDARTNYTQEYFLGTDLRLGTVPPPPTAGPLPPTSTMAGGAALPTGAGPPPTMTALTRLPGSKSTDSSTQSELTAPTRLPEMKQPQMPLDQLSRSLNEWADGKLQPDARPPSSREFLTDTNIRFQSDPSQMQDRGREIWFSTSSEKDSSDRLPEQRNRSATG